METAILTLISLIVASILVGFGLAMLFVMLVCLAWIAFRLFRFAMRALFTSMLTG